MLLFVPALNFHDSGMVGSGLCIFSKHSILETLSYRYSLNGYPQRVMHGDWFGGKMVGLAKIDVNDIRLNVYVTHVSVFCKTI
jgi:sphingomyelin phosphodiesterase 2